MKRARSTACFEVFDHSAATVHPPSAARCCLFCDPNIDKPLAFCEMPLALSLRLRFSNHGRAHACGIGKCSCPQCAELGRNHPRGCSIFFERLSSQSTRATSRPAISTRSQARA